MSDRPLRFSVRGSIVDLLAFSRLLPERRRRLARGKPGARRERFVNELAETLHPAEQRLVVDSIAQESPTTKTYRLLPDAKAGTKALAPFRAGQYLSLTWNIDGAPISRPYSISSSPAEAEAGFYEITIKRAEGGFFSARALDEWKAGDRLAASGPAGFAYYEALRDSNKVVGIAGGSGVTLFRSMARELAAGRLDLTLFYGVSDAADIMFKRELDELASRMPGRFTLVYVYSCQEAGLSPADADSCVERGFITGEILRRHCDPGTASFFLSGPQAMYDFVIPELKAMGVPAKRIRREAYGEIRDISRFPGYPKAALGKTFTIRIETPSGRRELQALGRESVLVALERAAAAGLDFVPASSCRSGECQFCRTRLIEGQVWTSPESDGRRAADRKFGWIHPCASFPLSDLVLAAPLGRS